MRNQPWVVAFTLVFLGLLPRAEAASPIQETAADETRPQVAYDSVNDRHLVVWNTGTGVSGRFYSGAGAPLGASFPIFWQRSLGGGDTLSYDQVAVTYKDSQRRFYVAARETYGDFVNPWVTIDTYGVAVKVLDEEGAELFNRLPYHSPTPATAMPANPTIVADTFGSTCCTLLAWQDDVSRDIRGLLLDDDGLAVVGSSGPFVIADGSSSTLTYRRPSTLYRRDWDQFVMVYERDPNSGPNRVGGRTIQAFTGNTSGELFNGTHGEDNIVSNPVGGPSIAYHPSSSLFLVAWTDGPNTFALGLDPDGPNPIPFNPVASGKLQVNRTMSFGGWPSWSVTTYSVIDAPAALPSLGSDGRYRVYVHEHSSSDSTNSLTTAYHVDLLNGTSVPTVISGFTEGPKSNAAAAYSPAADANLVVWQTFTSPFTNQHDIWGTTAAP